MKSERKMTFRVLQERKTMIRFTISDRMQEEKRITVVYQKVKCMNIHVFKHAAYCDFRFNNHISHSCCCFYLKSYFNVYADYGSEGSELNL